VSDGASPEKDASREAARAARAAAAHESQQARVLVADFVRAAREAGIEPVALRARGYTGSGSYRTDVRGWYLQPKGSLAIGEDGEFYVLTVAGGVVARVRGVTLEPREPQLTIGRGARDGESMALSELLQWRLAAGSDFRRL
jgi:hypothetical protein